MKTFAEIATALAKADLSLNSCGNILINVNEGMPVLVTTSKDGIVRIFKERENGYQFELISTIGDPAYESKWREGYHQLLTEEAFSTFLMRYRKTHKIERKNVGPLGYSFQDETDNEFILRTVDLAEKDKSLIHRDEHWWGKDEL